MAGVVVEQRGAAGRVREYVIRVAEQQPGRVIIATEVMRRIHAAALARPDRCAREHAAAAA